MQKILACLSPSPSNPKILSAAADMAGKDAELIALYVETPDFSGLGKSEQQRLEESILVAKQLGAAIHTISGDDIAFQIAEYARLSGIQKIVLGQSETRPSLFTSQTSLPDTLVKYLPDAEIHIIPDCRRPIYFPRQHAYEPNANGFIVRCTVPADMDRGVNPDHLLEEVYQTGQARNWCYPIHVQENTYALLYIAEQDPPPELASLSTLTSVLGECALALEKEKNVREKKEAAVLAENERVRAKLLRSISHDLRTPLMSISGNAGSS